MFANLKTIINKKGEIQNNTIKREFDEFKTRTALQKGNRISRFLSFC